MSASFLIVAARGAGQSWQDGNAHRDTDESKWKLIQTVCEEEPRFCALFKARKGLRDEIEALQAESDDGVVLSPEGSTSHPRLSMTEDQSEELLAFEARLASLHQADGENASPERQNGFGEVELYRQLREKLDLADDLIARYENKWRYTKIVKQLSLLKESFLEVLEHQSVNRLDLEPGTP